jgi:hypothetical protein
MRARAKIAGPVARAITQAPPDQQARFARAVDALEDDATPDWETLRAPAVFAHKRLHGIELTYWFADLDTDPRPIWITGFANT